MPDVLDKSTEVVQTIDENITSNIRLIIICALQTLLLSGKILNDSRIQNPDVSITWIIQEPTATHKVLNK